LVWFVAWGARLARRRLPASPYVANYGANTVSVIDTASNTGVATVPVEGGARGVAVTPNGKHAYVTNWGSATVSVIDTASNTVVVTVPLGGEAAGVAITPDGSHANVAGGPSEFWGIPQLPHRKNLGSVTVIATASNTVVATVTVGSNPLGVGIMP
ncbi:MAG: YncE family protein, partial [Methylocella sp.]